MTSISREIENENWKIFLKGGYKHVLNIILQMFYSLKFVIFGITLLLATIFTESFLSLFFSIWLEVLEELIMFFLFVGFYKII